jgi:hypothetical protein
MTPNIKHLTRIAHDHGASDPTRIAHSILTTVAAGTPAKKAIENIRRWQPELFRAKYAQKETK